MKEATTPSFLEQSSLIILEPPITILLFKTSSFLSLILITESIVNSARLSFPSICGWRLLMFK